jgi:hypothetical protein
VASFGSYGLRADLTAVAWPLLHQVFTGSDPTAARYFDRPPCADILDAHRLPKDYLTRHPVDMLVLGNLDKELADRWAQLIPGADSMVTPKVIVEFW